MDGLILVVDDNADIRETVCLLLETDGYRTVRASNGQEAISWLRCRTAPSLILLDLNMPVMDGYEFLVIKEADPRLVEVPVVVMTAVTDCSPLRGHRISGWMPKPASTGALLGLIKRCASR